MALPPGYCDGRDKEVFRNQIGALHAVCPGQDGGGIWILTRDDIHRGSAADIDDRICRPASENLFHHPAARPRHIVGHRPRRLPDVVIGRTSVREAGSHQAARSRNFRRKRHYQLSETM